MELEPHVVAVEPHDDHTLTLTFSNGEVKAFDAKPYLEGPAFQPLKDLDYFRRVEIDLLGSLVWPDEQDLAFDMLYELSEPVPAGAEH